MVTLKQTTITVIAAALLAPAGAQAIRPAGEGGGSTRGVALPKIANRTAASISTDNGLRVSGRKKPSTRSARVLRFKSGSAVKIVCQKRGQSVTGKFGTSKIWDLIDIGGGRGAFVTDTYVYTGSDGRVAPGCKGGGGSTPPPPAPSGFPKDVKRAPDQARYDDAAAWDGGRNCTGGFTVGAKRMQGWLRSNYGAADIGGYSCRPNTADTSKTSIHGVGRANDWFHSVNSARDRAEVASFIRRMTANGAAMARGMGVQYWIWNGQQYSVRGTSVLVRSYGGPNPHTDHVHIEMNLAGSRLQTSYWRKAAKG